MTDVDIPLASCASDDVEQLARASGSAALAMLDGQTLLGERATFGRMNIPGRVSAGGACCLFDASDDVIAFNLARPEDRELLPALFEIENLDTNDTAAIDRAIAQSHAGPLLARARAMGLAIAAVNEHGSSSANPCAELTSGAAALAPAKKSPRVVDLSALWAGPLAAHLLWLAGAEVIKVESRTRPDGLRRGDQNFFALLNQGKASVVLDFADRNDLAQLRALLATADIVIEAARPRALEQLGIDAAEIVRLTPGLTWITITAYGAQGAAAQWVGFGDDCAVAGGLTAALQVATGKVGFVGDAIADPLTGTLAARIAWRQWGSGRGGRWGISMRDVVAHSLQRTREADPEAFMQALRTWNAHIGQPFPRVTRRSIGTLSAFGEHTHACLAAC